jgi:hypothetical protein
VLFLLQFLETLVVCFFNREDGGSLSKKVCFILDFGSFLSQILILQILLLAAQDSAGQMVAVVQIRTLKYKGQVNSACVHLAKLAPMSAL